MIFISYIGVILILFINISIIFDYQFISSQTKENIYNLTNPKLEINQNKFFCEAKIFDSSFCDDIN